MSCSDCNTNHPSNTCPDRLRFDIDENYLVSSCAGYPIDPVDLTPVVVNSETDTRLQLDVAANNLVYSGEKATNSLVAPDAIPITDIANLIRLKDLGDVNYPYPTDGDILSFDSNTSSWISYTVPTGAIVTPVGIDTDGKIVKDGTGGTPQAPDTVPIGGLIEWTGEISDIPVSYKLTNGQALSRTVYSSLFTLYGTKYGSGDGVSTFNIPSTGTRSTRGYDPSDTQFNVIGMTGGAKKVGLTADNNGPHSHSIYDPRHTHTVPNVVYSSGSSNNSTKYPNDAHQVTWGNLQTYASGTGISIYSNGSGTPHENLGPYIVFPKIVRAI